MLCTSFLLCVVPCDGGEVRILKDVIYGAEDPRMQRLDAYLVQGPAPVPVLVEFHGGGWRRGHKSELDQYGGVLRRVVEEGITLISANYRLTPKAVWPAQAEDAARVVQFVRSRAREWNIDPDRIALIGGSAGAHLALWVGLHDDLRDPANEDPVRRESTRVSAIVDLWGPTKLAQYRAGAPRGGAVQALFGATEEELVNPDERMAARMRDASPVTFVSADDPPVLIVHNGPADASSPTDPRISGANMDAHSAAFGLILVERLKGVGITPEVSIAPDAGERVPERALPFLRRHLKLAAQPAK
jgi:acetyl esterase/lipase